MAEIAHPQDQKNAGVMVPITSHLMHHSDPYKNQMDCDGWQWYAANLNK